MVNDELTRNQRVLYNRILGYEAGYKVYGKIRGIEGSNDETDDSLDKLVENGLLIVTSQSDGIFEYATTFKKQKWYYQIQ